MNKKVYRRAAESAEIDSKTINSSTSLTVYKRTPENIRSSGILNYREAMEIISFLPSQQKRNNIFSLRSLRLEQSGR